MTLIEVVVAFAVLSIGVLALNATLIGATRVVGWSYRATRAAESASAIIEGLRTCDHPIGDTTIDETRFQWVADTSPGLAPLRLMAMPIPGMPPGDTIRFAIDLICR